MAIPKRNNLIRKYTNGQGAEHHYHQGNANENHSEIAVHTSHTSHVRRMAIIKKTRDKSVGKDGGKREPCTLLVGM